MINKNKDFMKLDNSILNGYRAREEDQLAELVLDPPSPSCVNKNLDPIGPSGLDRSHGHTSDRYLLLLLHFKSKYLLFLRQD